MWLVFDHCTSPELDSGEIAVLRYFDICIYQLSAIFSVFSVRSRDHACYQVRQAIRLIRRHIFRQDVELLGPLYKHQNTREK